MKIVTMLCLLLSTTLVAADQDASTGLARSTFRLRLQTIDGEYVNSGWGTAFGVDLSSYGISDAKYLLTAAHLVLKKSGKGLADGKLELELPSGGSKAWASCRVVAIDKKNDLCLLSCSSTLPSLAQLSKSESQKVGEAVAIVGCPAGVPPKVSMGKLTDKNPKVEGRLWEAAAQFYHGNSGGPVFDPASDVVIGVAVAGVSNGRGDMARNVALFYPINEVKKFLEGTCLPLLQQ
ncbi:MAG TPA: serine protease [Planctomycetota bacterium]|nr:serine protease [Planctomycetota bacterium]